MSTNGTLKAPFPWFGGKSKVAKLVWEKFGNVVSYVEPFFGSGAVLLGRPKPWSGVETVNDLDGFICNFFRALQAAPGEVAKWADDAVNECNLHARHVWLRERRVSLTCQLEGNPEYYDAKIAGWWCWGICCWIGSGWCEENTTGPWKIIEDDAGARQLVHLGDAGKGINRQLVHLGDAGMGINRQLVHLGESFSNGQRGILAYSTPIEQWFQALADRLKRVRVCCGNWDRILGRSVTHRHGLTGVFLDPPYSAETGRNMKLYAEESGQVAHQCREWAITNGDNPLLRIAICGYEGEHTMPSTWECLAWKAGGGYANQGNRKVLENRRRERIWFSPHCLKSAQTNLFAAPDKMPG